MKDQLGIKLKNGDVVLYENLEGILFIGNNKNFIIVNNRFHSNSIIVEIEDCEKLTKVGEKPILNIKSFLKAKKEYYELISTKEIKIYFEGFTFYFDLYFDKFTCNYELVDLDSEHSFLKNSVELHSVKLNSEIRNKLSEEVSKKQLDMDMLLYNYPILKEIF